MVRQAAGKMVEILKECERQAVEAKLSGLNPAPKPAVAAIPTWAKALFGVNAVSMALVGILLVEMPRVLRLQDTFTQTGTPAGKMETAALNLTLPYSEPVATDETGQVRYYSAYFAQTPAAADDPRRYRPYSPQRPF